MRKPIVSRSASVSRLPLHVGAIGPLGCFSPTRTDQKILMINRRMFVALLAAAPLAACETTQEAQPLPVPGDETSNWYIASLPDHPYDIPLIDWNLVPQEFHRQTVQYSGTESVGTIVINIAERHLYLVEPGGKAVRYGIGVGREGYSLRGAARVGRKAVWPDWNWTAAPLCKPRP